jgi:23S rRNA (uracil1939-C5)-methyltransferase
MEYEIIRLGHHGDGIADGPLFAPMTLPGEIVSGTADGQRLRDVRIVTPSDQRVRPPCRHFKSCGGCSLMHAADPFVAGWKQQIVVRALAAQGLEAEMRPIVTSPPQSRRRATFAARRTKGGAMVGFHGRASDTLVETPDCRLVTPGLLAGREVAGDLAVAGASRKAALDVQVTETLGGLDIAVSGGKPMDAALFSALSAIAEARSLARLTWDGEIVALRAPPEIAFGPARVAPPPGAFLQATAHGQQVLTEAVAEAVGDARRIVDLFAGCGTFALPLAQGAEVHAVEGDRAMLAALDHGWRHAHGLERGLKKVTTEARDLFRNPLLPDEVEAAEAVVIDPPRAGAEAQTAALARARVPVIAFVSCNPGTFARDAKTLAAAGYRLEWVQVVDQFRWSAHVELVARFALPHM